MFFNFLILVLRCSDKNNVHHTTKLKTNVYLPFLETGGRISSPSTATLTIAENDYPYGELEIVAKKTQSTSISVEENIGTLTAKVKRTKGNFGRISVSYQTIPGSALSGKGDMVHFETTQGIMTIGAKSWYDFEAYGDRYLILASNSSGDDGVYSGSSLYRWQGVFTKVQVC